MSQISPCRFLVRFLKLNLSLWLGAVSFTFSYFDCYRSPTKLLEGNVYISACHSVHIGRVPHLQILHYTGTQKPPHLTGIPCSLNQKGPHRHVQTCSLGPHHRSFLSGTTRKRAIGLRLNGLLFYEFIHINSVSLFVMRFGFPEATQSLVLPRMNFVMGMGSAMMELTSVIVIG